MKLSSIVSTIMIGALLATGGCAGYRLGSAKPVQYEAIQTIAVPTVKSDTLEPRSGLIITNSVIKEFQSDGTYRIESLANADATLNIVFADVERRQLRSARFDTLRTRELRYTIDLNWELVGRDGEVISLGTVKGNTDIFLDPNFQLSEREALPLAAEDAARKLVARLSEGW